MRFLPVRRKGSLIVLIDTWWNVNYVLYIRHSHTPLVLIDTWWNVNTSSNTKIVTSCLGFNRYMVECEYGHPKIYQAKPSVLIDTWWNVNYFGRVDIITAYRVLIDTWWNVNFQALFLRASSRTLVLIDTWWNVNFFKSLLLDLFKVLIDTWWNVNVSKITVFLYFSVF